VNKPNIKPWKPLLTSLLAMAGCSDASEGAKPPVEGPTASPTFHKDVKPILQAHCQGCHAPGEIAPLSLLHYADVKNVAGLVVARTQDGTMPPWGAAETDACTPRFGWKNDNRLTDAELATLEAWHKAGAPEGNPKDASADVPVDDGLKDVSVTVEPAKPFVTSGDADQFRCLVIDPKLTQDTYVNGLNVIPGNANIVHHVGVFTDRNGSTDALVDADGGFDCYGSAGFYDAQALGTWVPGGQPTEYPPNVGFLIPAGSKLVLQVHYHPAGKAETDLTRLQLRFLSQVPEYRVIFLAIGNATSQSPDGFGLQPGPNDKNGVEFLIPAGASGHTETIKRAIPEEFMGESLINGFKLYRVMPHMHYVGTDIKIDVERPSPQGADPSKECVVEVPKWDFNWQHTYTLNAPIEELPTLTPGDVMNVRCSYENTLNNPFVQKALLEESLAAPKDVALGEGTLDEMCVGLFNGLVKN
jgi:hypothetical protein